MDGDDLDESEYKCWFIINSSWVAWCKCSIGRWDTYTKHNLHTKLI